MTALAMRLANAKVRNAVYIFWFAFRPFKRDFVSSLARLQPAYRDQAEHRASTRATMLD
jgi:hypothetical protein